MKIYQTLVTYNTPAGEPRMNAELVFAKNKADALLYLYERWGQGVSIKGVSDATLCVTQWVNEIQKEGKE